MKPDTVETPRTSRSTLYCWLCVVAAFLLGILLTGQQAQAQNSPFKTKTLKNGLEVIVVENRMVPLVTVQLAAKNGSFTEPPQFSGLSHLYEHMFFKANEKYPSQEKFMEGLQSLGGSLGVSNATTHSEFVNYYVIIPNKNMGKGMEFISHAIRTPKFDTAELSKERYVVLGEFDRNEASPLFKIRYAVDSALWSPALFSRKVPLGLRETILGTTPAMMRDIQQRFYVPNNMALIVSGDVDAAKVFSEAERVFGNWKRGADPFPANNPPAFPPLQKQLVIREAAKIPYTYVQMSWHGPSLRKDDAGTYAADLFSTIVNLPNSRFQKKLIESGLALQAQTSYYSQHNVGPINITMVTAPQATKDAINTLMQEVKSWNANDYFTDEEMETAKSILEGDRIYEQESASQFATSSVPFWWASASLDYYTNYINNVKRLTRADIQRYLDTYIKGKNYVLGVAADQSTLNTLQLKQEEVLQ